MKVERMVRLATDGAPLADARERLFLRRRPAHAFEHGGTGVLERHVEIRQHLALSHQRNDLVDMRVGIDVVQPHPHAELAERARKVDELRAHLAAFPRARGVFQVDAVGRRVLGDDQQLLDPGGDQPLGLAQHVGGRPRDEIAAQLRDDAERAAVVATF